MEVNEKDIAVAFSQEGDTITWAYSPDIRITIYYEHGSVYEYQQGQAYVEGSTARSYKNSWPAVMLPPRHRYFYITLDMYYWHNYSKHPTTECKNNDAGFCPICMKRYQDHQIFLYLMCIPAVTAYVFVPHLMNRNTISPHISIS